MTSVGGRSRAGPDGAVGESGSVDEADKPTTRATHASQGLRRPVADPPVDPPRSDTGTLRRSRPPRPDGGEPTLRVGGDHPSLPPEVPGRAPEVDGSQGIRRPVPPTFPSPGQPPPGVARRDGRHARPDSRADQPHTPPDGYRPRHAAPDAPTEQLPAPKDRYAADDAADAVTTDTPLPIAPVPGPSPAAPAPLATTGPTPVDDPESSADRVRVVLAERRAPTRAVRTVAEIEQGTETGELLLGNLLRAQLTLAVRLGLVALLLLGSLPVLFLVLPSLGSVELVGFRIPWILMGLAPYPFLVLLGWLHIRAAERNELDFADNVED